MCKLRPKSIQVQSVQAGKEEKGREGREREREERGRKGREGREREKGERGKREGKSVNIKLIIIIQVYITFSTSNPHHRLKSNIPC